MNNKMSRDDIRGVLQLNGMTDEEKISELLERLLGKDEYIEFQEEEEKEEYIVSLKVTAILDVIEASLVDLATRLGALDNGLEHANQRLGDTLDRLKDSRKEIEDIKKKFGIDSPPEQG